MVSDSQKQSRLTKERGGHLRMKRDKLRILGVGGVQVLLQLVTLLCPVGLMLLHLSTKEGFFFSNFAELLLKLGNLILKTGTEAGFLPQLPLDNVKGMVLLAGLVLKQETKTHGQDAVNKSKAQIVISPRWRRLKPGTWGLLNCGLKIKK